MAVVVTWRGAGGEAAAALAAVVAGLKGGDVLRAVTVLVPSNQVGVVARRRLAREAGGVAAVSVLTTQRLAEQIAAGALASAGRRPVSTPVITAALRTVLADEPGLFGPVADHPATEEALAGAYRELRELPDDALAGLATASPKASDVTRICRAARERLAGAWYDEEDLLGTATELVAAGRADQLLSPTVVYLPQRLTGRAAGLLRAVAEREGLTVIAALTGDGRADAEVRAAVTTLGGADPAPAPVPPAAPAGVRVIATTDADEEVRAAVRTVVDAVRAGTPLGRTAILYGQGEPYGRIVHDQLQAAGLGANGPAPVLLSARLAGRTLLGLLRWREGGFRRWDLFAWLSGAPLRHDGTPVPTSGWEQVSRQAAVVSGRGDWDHLLERFATAQDREAARVDADPDQQAWLADRARHAAERARALRSFALGLIDQLSGVPSRSWSEHAQWAGRLLDDLLGGPAARAHWPTAEVKAVEALQAVLERLAALDGVEGPVTLEVFARTLQVVMDDRIDRAGRIGEGVMVGPLTAGVGLDVDLAVVLGLAEGTAPAAPADDPLLSDAERRSAGGRLHLQADLPWTARRGFLSVVAGSGATVLTAPHGDLRTSAERVPSRWVVALLEEGTGEAWPSGRVWDAGGPVEHVRSFEEGLRSVGVPATAQEHRLLTMASRGSGYDLRTDPDEVVARAASANHGRRSSAFTGFDGHLAGVVLPSPTERPTSTSRLQRYVVCPFAHLLGDLLGVEVVEEPEERLEMTPLDRGELMHAAWEQLVRATADRDAGGWTDDDHLRMRAIGEELCNDYQERGLTGRPLLWVDQRRRILDDLDRALRRDRDHRSASGARPVLVEAGFGTGGDGVGPVPLHLGDGRSVLFRGRIDRVDRRPDGTIEVIDYKTGGRKKYQKLSAENPVEGGRYLQLPVYALAAREILEAEDSEVWAGFWFATRKGEFERIGYDVTPEVLATTADILQQVVVSMEAGAFPAHPEASSTNLWITCPYCDPDGLGAGDLRRAWERKRSHPSLATYLALTGEEA